MFLIPTLSTSSRFSSSRMNAINDGSAHKLAFSRSRELQNQRSAIKAVLDTVDAETILKEMEIEVLKEAGLCPAIREFRKMEHKMLSAMRTNEMCNEIAY